MGNQNSYIEEEQTTQWPKDNKWVIKICISKKNRQHNGQKIPYINVIFIKFIKFTTYETVLI